MPVRQRYLSTSMSGLRGMMTVEERTIYVYAIPHKITVVRKSKSVWEAVGDYKGEPIGVKGSSADIAAKYWVDAARIRGN